MGAGIGPTTSSYAAIDEGVSKFARFATEEANFTSGETVLLDLPPGALATTRATDEGGEMPIMSTDKQREKGITNTALVEDAFFENHDHDGKTAGDCTMPENLQAERQRLIENGQTDALEALDGYILAQARRDQAPATVSLGSSLGQFVTHIPNSSKGHPGPYPTSADRFPAPPDDPSPTPDDPVP